MRQEIDERTKYLLQNHSMIEGSVPKEPEPEVAANLMAFANFIDCLNHYFASAKSDTKP